MEKDEILLEQEICCTPTVGQTYNLSDDDEYYEVSGHWAAPIHFPQAGNRVGDKVMVPVIKKYQWSPFLNQPVLGVTFAETGVTVYIEFELFTSLTAKFWIDLIFQDYNYIGASITLSDMWSPAQNSQPKFLTYQELFSGANYQSGSVINTNTPPDQIFANTGDIKQRWDNTIHYTNTYIPNKWAQAHAAAGGKIITQESFFQFNTGVFNVFIVGYRLHLWYKYELMDNIKYQQLQHRLLNSRPQNSAQIPYTDGDHKCFQYV